MPLFPICEKKEKIEVFKKKGEENRVQRHKC